MVYSVREFPSLARGLNMAHLAVSLLGPLQALLDGRAIAGFRSDKTRALLVLLAVEADRPHARETLIELLWPGYPEAAALTYLRTTLANLRQCLGDCDGAAAPAVSGAAPRVPFLLVTRETLQLNPAADLTLDCAAFVRLLGGQPSVEALEQAVALYRGPFLEGFSLARSAPFDEWLLLEREHFKRLQLSALQRLASACISRGRYAQAEIHTHRQLVLEPWDETAHRQHMAALALGGRRGAALAQYENCRRLLEQELGVSPTWETTDLYNRICDGTFHAAQLPADDAALTLAAPLAASAPVVAREQELAHLNRQLERALQGNGRVVFVGGDAGSGKTSLLGELARRAMQHDAAVVVAGGGCSACSGRGDPYLPFREIVQMLTGDMEVQRASGAIGEEQARRLWAVAPVAAQLLTETAPDLVGRFVPGEALLFGIEAMRARMGSQRVPAWHAALSDRVQRLRSAEPAAAMLEQGDLFAQLTVFLQGLARRRPLLLLLDDLQWADAGTVSLLFHLGRRLAGCRILLVGAYRPEEVAAEREGSRHPLATVVHELQRDVGDAGIDLDRADGRLFVDALLDSEPNRLDAHFRETLYRHTEGHALFTVELLRGLKARGALVQDADGAWCEGTPPAWDRLPPRVEAIVAERIERLPGEWRLLLDAACVEGEVFTAELLAQLSALDERRVAWALREVLRRRHHLVQADVQLRVPPHGQRLSRYRFAHALYQKYLYGALDSVERAYLHEQVAGALERLYGPAADAIAAQLAWHCEQAGNVEKAIHYRQQAGDRAMTLPAMEEAIAHYSRALALLATLPATRQTAPQHAERERALRVALVAPLNVVRGWGGPEATNAIARAYALSRTADGSAGLLETVLLIQVHAGQAALEKALGLGTELLRLVQANGDALALAEAHFALGETYFFRGELEAARRHLEQSLAHIDSPAFRPLLLGVDLQVACLVWLSWVLWPLGYPAQAEEARVRALARARTLNAPATLGFALAVGANACVQRGEQEAARALTDELLRLADEKGLVLYQIMGAIIQGMAQTEQGQCEAGLAQIRQALAAWQAAGTVVGSVEHRANLVRALRAAGEVEQALAVVEESLALVEKTGLRQGEAELWRQKAELLLAQSARPNREADAEADGEACLTRAVELARARRARLWELRASVSLCRLWQAQGKHEAALALLAPLYAWFTEGFDTPDLRAARALLGELTPTSLHQPA